jgi:nucleotide-binding universal stress UspA family protein
VTVICANEDGIQDFNQDGLVQHLGWHGIRARKATVRVGPAGVGAALLGGARRAGADLLVMGAFTHSRLREMILGGATQHILSKTTMPVLLAH